MQTIEQLFQLMVDNNASDLFLSIGARPSIKVNGQIKPVDMVQLDDQHAEGMIYSLMDADEIEAFKEDLEFNKAHTAEGIGRFRINVFKQRGHLALVARLIPAEIPSVTKLGLPSLYEQLVMEERGLILIVGSAGSGKTTSMASMIDYRNQNSAGHILTIEDPIEILHEHKRSVVDQREVGLDTHSFSNALRNAMREAPDVIVIGEIRDYESMKHALTYAETGHLCISTLHANNASHAIERIMSFYPEKFHDQVLMDLSLHLKAILSQRLVKLADGTRHPAVEVMINTALISDLIKNGKVHEVRDVMERDGTGCQSFDQSLLELFRNGVIDKDTALEHAESRANLNAIIRQTTLS